MPLASAGLTLDGRAFGLIFRPMLMADAKKARVSGRFDFGIELISLAVSAFIRYPVVRFCEACTVRMGHHPHTPWGTPPSHPMGDPPADAL